MNFPDTAALETIVAGMIHNKHVHGAVFHVENGKGDGTYVGAAGNMNPDQRYYLASVTKLLMSAVILHLRENNQLGLDDPIHPFFPVDMLQGLHVFKGVEYTNQITIRHLLSNTSGIPDYFSQKSASGEATASRLMAGEDQPWSLEKSLEMVKGMSPRFIPGHPGKVQYSDTNYQLLGYIVEQVTGKPLAAVFQEILFDPMGLFNTYAYQDIRDESPMPLYFQQKQIHLPRYMASITAEGGVVSTAQESMQLLKAFFLGRFFDAGTIEELKQWRLIYSPGQFYFGLGLEKLWMPRILTPLKPLGEVLGFWGQSGAFAFHHPETDLYFTGTVNQLSGRGHSAAFRAMYKTIRILQSS